MTLQDAAGPVSAYESQKLSKGSFVAQQTVRSADAVPGFRPRLVGIS